ncbi:L-ribulose-5-phosphate 3-epimerase [Selenomonas ruminis]|uniref:L-ribulose-5-phosphate 3-epimerase n=1 Tax=Selenomonas ruminis TaxID=2593411 RepID=A0A5D6W0L9_9FIRM|nr:L-ribulose-5-phosphate 3-epimerase [Selenomonas sp. mPRGC5]TYZ20345.1 L-ribulose-5-phosphate 3-epimerase [Selenomonas sp. mPRGC5]
MSKYQLGLYEKSMPGDLTWAEKLQAAKNAGFDYVEMSIDETDAKLARLDMTDGEIDEVRAAMRATGVPFRSICLSGHRKFPLGCPDMQKQDRSLDIMQKAVALAAKLGIRTIQLAGYDVYYEEGTDKTRADFLQNLRKAADMAAAEGIQMGFETMETPFMDTVEKAMNYVRQVDSPYLGVYPDSGNITNAALLYDGDVADDLETGRGHIVAVHLKETVPGKYREIPFGTGHVDFQKIVNKSWQLGVRRFVGEFWYDPQTDWREELQKANDFLRSYLDKAE